MTIKLGVVMDPIASIHAAKDSTLAMLLAAQQRDWEIYYFEPKDLFVRDGKAYGTARLLKVYDDHQKWFDYESDPMVLPLSQLNVILMRKDPPFNPQYIYTTYLLELAERDGVLVVNKPQSLRDANEKFFTTHFPACCPPTLVTQEIKLLREFLQEQRDIVCKPLDGMGGSSVFRLQYPDQNASVVFELLTQYESRYIMAQAFIPAIAEGDKRILLIDGQPVPLALARIPAAGELRGNLAAGGTGIARPLSKRDLWICEQVGPELSAKGLYFVGLDVIGDFLTEINVTSPTCIRQLDEQGALNIAGQLLDWVESQF